MPTTRATFRQLFGERVGGFHELVTTGAGGGSGETVVSTQAVRVSPNDDYFNHWWCVLPLGPTGSGSYEAQEVLDYTGSSGTITLRTSFTAQVEDAVTFQLLRGDVYFSHNDIDRAIEELYPRIYLPLRDETLVVDNLLANPGFEEAISGGAHPSWTNDGAPTVTAETSIVRHGAQSAKVVAGGATGQMQQAVVVSINEITGRTIRLKVWVYATVADKGRINLDFGSETQNSSHHTGIDEWQLLTLETTVPSGATQLQVELEVAANATVYFDIASLVIGPVYRLTVPAAFIHGPHFISQQQREIEPNGVYYPIVGDRPRPHRILRLEGMGLLTIPTSDTGSVEISAQRANLVAAYAAWLYFRRKALDAGGETESRYARNRDNAESDVDRLLAQRGMVMPAMSAEDPTNYWHLERTGETAYLVFDQNRGGPASLV